MLVVTAIFGNLCLYIIVPRAELAKDLIVDGQIIVPKGEVLTGLRANKLWQRYRQRMEFQCVFCKVPLTDVKVHEETWKKSPHFRSNKNKKEEHIYPCEYAGESKKGTTPTGEFEVADDKLEIPTKLKKFERKQLQAVATSSESTLDGMCQWF